LSELTSAKHPKIVKYAYRADFESGLASPWMAAFPDRCPLGFWETFQRRCEKIVPGEMLVNETTARRVWLSILWEYEDYERMGMWIPEAVLEDHKRVARALGWY
jgi:hypothetical protein